MLSAAVPEVNEGGSLRLVLACFVSLVYLCLVLIVQPFRRDDDNALGGLGAVALVGTYLSAIVVKTSAHIRVHTHTLCFLKAPSRFS